MQVGEFLGLPEEAFDGQTSLTTSRIYDLVVHNRFFDGPSMANWAPTFKESKNRPMLVIFHKWWQTTGNSLHGHRKRIEVDDELAWAEFFQEGDRFREWKLEPERRREEKKLDAEMHKECQQMLSFHLIKCWFPDCSEGFAGEILRKIRGERWQLREYHAWLRRFSPEELRAEVLAFAQRLRGERCGEEGV